MAADPGRLHAGAESPSAVVTEATIGLLIERFYARARRDPVLAAVFDAAVAPAEWPCHLATMRRFWSSVMLGPGMPGSGHYSGDPAAVHRAVRGLRQPMFARWLTLFDEAAHEQFAPAVAEQFTTVARRIAASLERALFAAPGLPGAPPGVVGHAG